MNLEGIVNKYEKLNFGLLEQGEFLEKMGLGVRLDSLVGDCEAGEGERLRGEYERLVGSGEMGKVYKFMFIGEDLVFPFGEA